MFFKKTKVKIHIWKTCSYVNLSAAHSPSWHFKLEENNNNNNKVLHGMCYFSSHFPRSLEVMEISNRGSEKCYFQIMHDCFPDIPEREKWTETIIFDRQTDELVYPTLIDQAKNKQANKNQPLNHPEGFCSMYSKQERKKHSHLSLQTMQQMCPQLKAVLSSVSAWTN